MTDKTTETAILAGGCFWCIEAVFLEVEGVSAAQSGYIGGHVEAPTYEEVCSGDTGHAEAVKIDFDPRQIGFAELLDIFFAIHDPTTPNRQGNDVGTQYRSAIFTTSPEQDAIARAKIEALAFEGEFDAPIVTEIEPAATFWPAEPYHANYFARNGAQPYCRMVVGPKVAKFRSAFAGRRKGN
ncbi:MAG TPA: peptide-methionine (S)-S-oxide reductase MsrA [Zoogloea sp.]|uniref:peptide-methionine (S)-S-oxide reductase MsrA n=1 Tax=Zoogloea sp. TaxID=49181 RepID=UPI002BBEE8C8|nr:peptide-methionine (S)-S-oxide reductase MsrA [Zoogloea sp.]HOB46259.1 peptide-methionine (S)-S-oxide reductase MsrA [Zoogloea sp.]HQA09501.1 peptide-methionine (S)-S-oxide reductase MsrA [Zoogloea sp.]